MAVMMTVNKRGLALVFLLGAVLLPGLLLASERMAVSTATANIRNGPGTNFDIIWKVERYYPFLVLEKKGQWYKVEDFEGDKGWLHSSLLDNTATIIVNKDDCNVRSGPGTNFPIVFRAKSGVPFKILIKQGKWINIQHADGDTGWIHRSLVW